MNRKDGIQIHTEKIDDFRRITKLLDEGNKIEHEKLLRVAEI